MCELHWLGLLSKQGGGGGHESLGGGLQCLLKELETAKNSSLGRPCKGLMCIIRHWEDVCVWRVVRGVCMWIMGFKEDLLRKTCQTADSCFTKEIDSTHNICAAATLPQGTISLKWNSHLNIERYSSGKQNKHYMCYNVIFPPFYYEQEGHVQACYLCWCMIWSVSRLEVSS